MSYTAEEHWGEVQNGEHAGHQKPEEGPPPMGERKCKRCGRMMLVHRGNECPAIRSVA